MTIERTRQLLGNKVKNMTDEQVQQLIASYAKLADVALDALQKISKSAYSGSTAPSSQERRFVV